MLKRCFDFLIASIALVLLSPVLVVLAACVKLGSKGPVFYRGLRSGRHGRPFRIFKFRSMVADADHLGGPSTSNNDCRITGVGRLMRQTKLDELPQLFNVVRGQMSLVGPRPQVPDYVARYTDEEQQVLTVQPGITDWASIWNSDEGSVLAQFDDPDRAYDELIHPTKMRLQLRYVQDHRFRTDLKILASTACKLVSRNWVPAELRDYPRPGVSDERSTLGFDTVTEIPGTAADAEQLAMLHTRYGWAGDLAAGKEVLEVACGSGIGLGHLATRAARVVGGDYDPRLVAIARGQHRNRLDIRQADAQSLPYDDASFDVVLLFEAIYYLPNPELFVQEAYRVLRPGGSLLVCTANCERPDFNLSPFSTRYLSAKALHQLLEKYGFDPTMYAAFPLRPSGTIGRIRHAVRRAAVRLHLVPKTMKWKSRVKRLIFGKLEPLPAMLGVELVAKQPLVEVDPMQPVHDYKVLYGRARRRAVTNSAAA